MSSVNNIREDKSVNADNFEFLLAQSNYNLSSVFRSLNHNESIPDTPMCSDDKTLDVGTSNANLGETQSRNHQYSFKVVSPSTNQIVDLKDVSINVVASVFTNKTDDTDAVIADVPRLGNQALLGLFSTIELYCDSVLIERIELPGFSSNAHYALAYPHSHGAEECLESHGFITKIKDEKQLSEPPTTVKRLMFKPNTTLTTQSTIPDIVNALEEKDVIEDVSLAFQSGVYSYDNASVAWGTIKPTGGNTRIRGVITQKIKLADIFPSVSTLPPIFNHAIQINFTRNSENNVIASVCNGYTPLKLNAFIDFKITSDNYIVSDELKKACMEYYSKDIQTIFTRVKTIPVSFPSKPTANSTMSFNISVDTAYKNKLAVFAIPRSTNFNNQTPSKCHQKSSVDNYRDVAEYQYDVASSPANSYTHGGLRSFTVYSSNGLKLYGFDMSRNGNTRGPIEQHEKIAMLDVKTTPANVLIQNYQEVYQAYLSAREQFGQIKEEGVDYMTFLKEYCIFCVDLSPFSINAGENLRVEMVFDDWNPNYSPYHALNNGGVANGYVAKQILCMCYMDKVLRLLPNAQVELSDLFAARTEADETNEI